MGLMTRLTIQLGLAFLSLTSGLNIQSIREYAHQQSSEVDPIQREFQRPQGPLGLDFSLEKKDTEYPELQHLSNPPNDVFITFRKIPRDSVMTEKGQDSTQRETHQAATRTGNVMGIPRYETGPNDPEALREAEAQLENLRNLLKYRSLQRNQEKRKRSSHQ